MPHVAKDDQNLAAPTRLAYDGTARVINLLNLTHVLLQIEPEHA